MTKDMLNQKELEFIVFSPILGDLNGDEILNVSDIIIIVGGGGCHCDKILIGCV